MPSSNPLFGLMLLALMASPVGAADKEAGKAAREQVRRLQEQKRALEMEKSQWQEERNTLSRQLAVAEADREKRKTAEAGLREAQRRLRSASDGADRLKSELTEMAGRLASKTAEAEKLASQLAAEQAGRGRAEKDLGTCSVRNEALYRQGRELIQSFARHGECDAVVKAEPVLGLGRVSRENALEAERDALEEQRFRPLAKN